jgi:hypothetical protein
MTMPAPQTLADDAAAPSRLSVHEYCPLTVRLPHTLHLFQTAGLPLAQ